MEAIVNFLFRVYKLLFSPILVFLFGGGCRFSPTCSKYAHEAILKHGLWKGGQLALGRISRCHPGHAFVYDPVR